jgi:CelD/BcsL family acetyltransferase involved in cellulose biosynthesis
MATDGRFASRVIQDEDSWDAIRPDWDDLHRSIPDASVFLDFVWLRAWWRDYGAEYGSGGLRILTMWRDGILAGALPLYVNGRSSRLHARWLRFISTGEAEIEETCPDYLDLLCRPGAEAECAALAWRDIARLEWDRLDLLDVPATSALLRSASAPRRARRVARGACPIADLTGGFDAYLGRLSSNSRQQARRLLREADQAGARFELATEDDGSAAFDDLVRLHQDRWTAEQKPGAFASRRFTDFHRGLVREWMPGGHVVLARLFLQDAPVAVLYGFITGSSFAFYQSGVKLGADGPLRSPGNLAHLLLMKTLADRGVTAYDFLRGSASYKERLATSANELAAIQVRRPTLREAASWPVRLAGHVARRHFRLGTGARP